MLLWVAVMMLATPIESIGEVWDKGDSGRAMAHSVLVPSSNFQLAAEPLPLPAVPVPVLHHLVKGERAASISSSSSIVYFFPS